MIYTLFYRWFSLQYAIGVGCSSSCATSVAKPTNHTRGWELLGHTLAFSDACAMA